MQSDLSDEGAQPRPIKPARMTIRMVESVDRLAFTHRHRQWGRGGFMVFWLIGWTVGCVFLINEVAKAPKLHTLLFAVPFWASWLFVFALLLNMFFRLDYFSIGNWGVVVRRRVIVPIFTRQVPLKEIRRFQSCSKVTDSESGLTEWGIEMRTVGRSMQFAWGLPEQEREWLIFQLNRCLETLQGHPVHEETALPEDSREAEAEGEPLPRILSPPEPMLEPPSDASWRRVEDFRDVVFVRKGRFSPSAVGGLLFINAFWNGIVSVFLFELWSGDAKGMAGIGWWGLFFFLIPFEAIGLVMFLALIAALMEPFRRTSLRITDSSIERRTKWFGVGPVRRHWIDGLARIDLRGADGGRKWKKRFSRNANPDGEDGDKVELSFVDGANAEVCTMGGLTEGEARWMSDTIRRERPDWFR